MLEFQYTARTESGQKVVGVLQAESEAAFLRLLEDRKLFPVSVKGGKGITGEQQKPARRRVRTRYIGIMYGQLADLIGSGVPLLRALDSLIKSTVNPNLRELLKEVRASVADGKSFTEALRQFPDVFPQLHTAMVQAGERAAFLEQVLRSLSDFLERLDELRGKVLGAMIYPTLLTVLGTGVMIAALIFFRAEVRASSGRDAEAFAHRDPFCPEQSGSGLLVLDRLGDGGNPRALLVQLEQREEPTFHGELPDEDSGGRNGIQDACHHPILSDSRDDAGERCPALASAEDKRERHRLHFAGGTYRPSHRKCA